MLANNRLKHLYRIAPFLRNQSLNMQMTCCHGARDSMEPIPDQLLNVKLDIMSNLEVPAISPKLSDNMVRLRMARTPFGSLLSWVSLLAIRQYSLLSHRS